MPAIPQQVKLGDHTYLLVAQRHAYLKRRLTGVIDSLQGTEVEDAGGIMELVGSRIFEVLRAFIPDFMPRYEFEGYASEQAMVAEEYHEAADRSPSYAEQFDAIAAALEVNGLNRLKALGNVVSPELIRALIAEQVANMATQRSLSSPSPNGASPSPNGSPTSPTSSAATDGTSIASST